MIDDFDCRIIHHLTLDGRMSINELSERVNLSQTPVARRVKKLEDNKIITGYTALIDETRLGFSFSVFVSVRLEKQIDDNLAKFERRISTMPEVVDCWLMTGSYGEVYCSATERKPSRLTSNPSSSGSSVASLALRGSKYGQT